MHSSRDIIHETGALEQKWLIHVLVTGVVKITGVAHHLPDPTIAQARSKVTKAKGALVVPKWRSAPFWPLLDITRWGPTSRVCKGCI